MDLGVSVTERDTVAEHRNSWEGAAVILTSEEEGQLNSQGETQSQGLKMSQRRPLLDGCYEGQAAFCLRRHLE